MNRLAYAPQTPLRTAGRIFRAVVFPLALLLCLSAALSLVLLLGLSALSRPTAVPQLSAAETTGSLSTSNVFGSWHWA